MSHLIDLDATDQLAALRAGWLTVPELAEMTLDRIDGRNPVLNAVISLRDRDAVMAEAVRLQSGPPRGPLHGLPIAIKDLTETAGVRTTYGFLGTKDFVPTEDSPMVARLRAAGALVIGKTNTPEFGLGSHSYNRVSGVTRNPYDPSRSAGGSSGGAGAALAARMVALADGSDMMGSLRNPAAWNNVYGFRPGYGLVPNTPMGDMFLHPLSTDGPMARSIRDLELLLGVQAAHDGRHPASVGPYVPHTGRVPPLRIGWLGDWGGAYPMEAEISALCEAGLAVLEDLGHTVVTLAPPFPADLLWQSWTTLRSWAVAEKLRPIWQSGAQAALLKPEAQWEIERGRSLSAAEVHAASVIASDWFRRRAELPVDVIALPSAQMFPFPADWDWPKQVAGREMDTYHRWMEVVVPASLIGLPALSVPVGFGASGLPMGLQLIGRRGEDALVLAMGRAYEAATDWPGRRPPPAPFGHG